MHEPIEALSDTCREILFQIKKRGGATIAELAGHLGISDEGTRQHLLRLERKGWVVRRASHDSGGRSGRPAATYVIGDQGECFFPKRYPELSLAMMDTVRELFGHDAVSAALERVAEAKVREWEPTLAGKPLDERLRMLTSYYAEGDPFMHVDRNGATTIVERNCPYMAVAMERPALCGITVNVLSRLLGYRVCRRRRFQDGDGCCEFQVMTDQPVAAGARFEPEVGQGG